jgi:hypothetical protein
MAEESQRNSNNSDFLFHLDPILSPHEQFSHKNFNTDIIDRQISASNIDEICAEIFQVPTPTLLLEKLALSDKSEYSDLLPQNNPPNTISDVNDPFEIDDILDPSLPSPHTQTSDSSESNDNSEFSQNSHTRFLNPNPAEFEFSLNERFNRFIFSSTFLCAVTGRVMCIFTFAHNINNTIIIPINAINTTALHNNDRFDAVNSLQLLIEEHNRTQSRNANISQHQKVFECASSQRSQTQSCWSRRKHEVMPERLNSSPSHPSMISKQRKRNFRRRTRKNSHLSTPSLVRLKQSYA